MSPIKNKSFQTNEKIYAIRPNCLIDPREVGMAGSQESKGASRKPEGPISRTYERAKWGLMDVLEEQRYPEKLAKAGARKRQKRGLSLPCPTEFSIWNQCVQWCQPCTWDSGHSPAAGAPSPKLDGRAHRQACKGRCWAGKEMGTQGAGKRE